MTKITEHTAAKKASAAMLPPFTAEQKEEVCNIMQKILQREHKLQNARDYLWVVAIDEDYRLLDIELITKRPINAENLKPADILGLPLSKKAAGIIMIYAPLEGAFDAPEVFEIGHMLIERFILSCLLMKVPLLDYLVIDESRHYSFRESGILEKVVVYYQDHPLLS